MQDPDFQPPVNPLPPAVVAFFVAIAGIEAVLSLAEAGLIGGREAIGWRLGLIQDYGFSGDIFDFMWTNRIWPINEVLRVFSYPFIHLSFMHGLFAMVLLLALGKMVAEAMGQMVFVALFVLSGVGGAVVYALLLNDPVWLVGAYPQRLRVNWRLFLCDVAHLRGEGRTAAPGVFADCDPDGDPIVVGRFLSRGHNMGGGTGRVCLRVWVELFAGPRCMGETAQSLAAAVDCQSWIRFIGKVK